MNGRHAPKELIDQWNAKTVAQFEFDLNRKLDDVVLNPNQFDALFSLAWNRGVYSDVVKKVIEYCRAGDYDSAAYTIATGPKTIDGVFNQGLAKRRQEEANLFSTPWQEPAAEEPTPANAPAWGSRRTLPTPWYKDSFVLAHVAMGTLFFTTLALSLRKHFGQDKIAEAYAKEVEATRQKPTSPKPRPTFDFGPEPSTSNPRTNPNRLRSKKRSK